MTQTNETLSEGTGNNSGCESGSLCSRDSKIHSLCVLPLCTFMNMENRAQKGCNVVKDMYNN